MNRPSAAHRRHRLPPAATTAAAARRPASAVAPVHPPTLSLPPLAGHSGTMADPADLPIRRYQQQIADSVRQHPVTVVIGETGSGKTTQISQILEEAGFAEHGVIGVTQPRRVVRLAAAAAHACRARCGRPLVPTPAPTPCPALHRPR